MVSAGYSGDSSPFGYGAGISLDEADTIAHHVRHAEVMGMPTRCIKNHRLVGDLGEDDLDKRLIIANISPLIPNIRHQTTSRFSHLFEQPV
jgi:hypothetical protein